MKHINPAQIKLDNFRKAIEKMEPGKGWAWAIQESDGSWILCNWVDPMKASSRFVEIDGKPSPEAQRVYVAIVPMKEYRKLLKAK
jgi:hypothetical protein